MLLPDSHAFLVRLGDRIEPLAPKPIGRVEHLESGLSRRFLTLEEMCEFISEILADDSAIEAEERRL